MPGTGIATPKAVGVGAEKMRLLGRHRRALAVGDALAGGKGSRLDDQGQTGGLLTVDGPGLEQVQIGALLGLRRHIARIRQGGKRILRRETGNVIRCLHGLLNGSAGKIRGAGVATALADIDRHAQRLVPVTLHVLQFPLANRHAQATALRGFCTGIGGAELLGMGQRGVNQFLKIGAAVAEAGVSSGRGSRWGGGRVGFLHIGSYDTWLCHVN